MNIKIPSNRLIGLLCLALLVCVPIGASIQGYDTTREGWSGDLSRLGDMPAWEATANVQFQRLAGLGLVVAGVGLALTLQARARTTAYLSGSLLAVAGVLVLVSSALYDVAASLARDYVDGTATADDFGTSRTLMNVVGNLTTSATLAMGISIFALAIAAARHHLLAPRAVYPMVALSAAALAVAVVADWSGAGTMAWVAASLGFFTLWAWLLIAGVTLILTGGSGERPRGLLESEAT